MDNIVKLKSNKKLILIYFGITLNPPFAIGKKLVGKSPTDLDPGRINYQLGRILSL